MVAGGRDIGVAQKGLEAPAASGRAGGRRRSGNGTTSRWLGAQSSAARGTPGAKLEEGDGTVARGLRERR